jgi:hypothetical protein
MFRQDQTGSKWIKMDQNRTKNKNKVNSFNCIEIKKVLKDQKYYSLKQDQTGLNRIKTDQNGIKHKN